MRQLLQNILVACIPFLIPLILVASFLVNHKTDNPVKGDKKQASGIGQPEKLASAVKASSASAPSTTAQVKSNTDSPTKGSLQSKDVDQFLGTTASPD